MAQTKLSDTDSHISLHNILIFMRFHCSLHTFKAPGARCSKTITEHTRAAASLMPMYFSQFGSRQGTKFVIFNWKPCFWLWGFPPVSKAFRLKRLLFIEIDFYDRNSPTVMIWMIHAVQAACGFKLMKWKKKKERKTIVCLHLFFFYTQYKLYFH